MSLNWNAQATEWAALPKAEKDKLWPYVEGVIFLTMAIGVGRITTKNVDDVLARIRYFELVRGKMMHSDSEDLAIPETLIRQLIGLSTNVSPLTWRKFTANMADNWRRDFDRDLRRAKGD